MQRGLLDTGVTWYGIVTLLAEGETGPTVLLPLAGCVCVRGGGGGRGEVSTSLGSERGSQQPRFGRESHVSALPSL